MNNEHAIKIKNFLIKQDIACQETPVYFEKMSGGYSNYTYKVDVHDKSFVARLWGAVTLGKSEPHQELSALKTAAKLDLYPKNFFYDEDDAFLLCPFLEGKPLLDDPTSFQNDLKEMAKTLRLIHQTPSPIDKAEPLDKRILVYYDLLNPLLNSDEQKEFEALCAPVIPLYEQLCKNNEKTLIHGDIHAKNFLKTNDHLYLLDWEFASYDNPLWDLGYFLVQENLNPHDERAFLSSYFQEKPIPEDVFLWKKLAAIMLTLWCELNLRNNYHPNDTDSYQAYLVYCKALALDNPAPFSRDHFLWQPS